MLQLTTILHPTDFSEHSEYALRLAASLARDHDARLVIVHVVMTLGPEAISYGEAVSQLQPQAYQEKLWDELRRIRPSDPEVAVEHVLREGDPPAEIIRAAEEIGAGLIVMATHGRTGLRRVLMGSVAEEVMRKAGCPVLTVKSPHAPVP
jgi:nucleotide-binding universal stress UspA family protein